MDCEIRTFASGIEVAQESARADETADASPFLKLPLELRYSILEYLLVRDQYFISALPTDCTTIVRRHRWRSNLPRGVSYPQLETLRSVSEDVDSCEKTYEILYESECRDRRPSLEVFLVNKQVHSESQAIFYGKNIFQFSRGNQRIYGDGVAYWMREDSIHACLAFLRDRPQGASQHIHAIGLELGKDLHSTVTTQVTSTLWSQFCDKLNKTTRLRMLQLTIHGDVTVRNSDEKVVELDERLLEWRTQLCRIASLQNLVIHILRDFNSDMRESEENAKAVTKKTIAFVTDLRTKMLHNGGTYGLKGIFVGRRMRYSERSSRFHHISQQWYECLVLKAVVKNTAISEEKRLLEIGESEIDDLVDITNI